ncbi:MAG: nucleoside hydrolase [Bacteroidota bacterium]
MQSKFYITAILFCLAITSAISQPSVSKSRVKPQIPKIIFDTDMGPDYDDIGAIAVLHALAAKGECEILATVASDGHVSIAPVIELFNSYYLKPNIPIGVPGKTAPNFPSGNNWNEVLLKQYKAEALKDKKHKAAVEVYREVLARAKDNSVTIVTVGFLSNISDLLDSKPDKFSSLSGIDLVKKKVKNWVAMAGAFPQGREFNVERDAAAGFNAINKWPKPILFSGFEIGDKIFTGGKVSKNGSAGSPVAWGFAYNLRTYLGKEEQNRQSWDETAVLCAVRNPSKYFYVNGPGKFVVDKGGNNTWDPDVNANHYFLSHKYPYQKIADVLDELMMFEPKK